MAPGQGRLFLVQQASASYLPTRRFDTSTTATTSVCWLPAQGSERHGQRCPDSPASSTTVSIEAPEATHRWPPQRGGDTSRGFRSAVFTFAPGGEVHCAALRSP